MSKKVSLSLCMIVKDEEKTLARALNSVKSFIDEIIIVDTGSTDKTKIIAQNFNAMIYDFKWINDFSAARNFSFSKATSDYILWLDGDDFINDENIKKIENLLSNLDSTYDYINAEYILGRNEVGNINYSLRRNRIVKRNMNFKWIGNVHEYLEVYGTGLNGDFQIEHGKIKAYTNRNLGIYKQMEKKRLIFNPRDLFYYANELKDNCEYKEAIKNYRKFLETKQGWIEDVKSAYSNIINCNLQLNMKDKIPNIAFESFKEDSPRADICCALADYYLEENKLKQAAFWYRTALDCIPEKGNIAIDNKEYYTSIPSLQLCLCYFKMGNLNCSYFFNELAASFIPNSPKIKYNREFFENEYNKPELKKPEIDYPIRLSDYVRYL
ncbi:Glycosyltransferase involved in cell wall bisynthesis [Clostridium cavendishii DSM 21758]|uniref:Glycosyltransferase involved in cell wall bisynthesis n=1 Tax=Clostridium cavendishii DSM 21758 TaxID=1121302 RepID=A0A1M6JHJ0_9CLOT|nr:glycosyltransferase family 2 protein [Clostridium cavendishii]SHJ46085.1 Glycosyltransferase involved in cell wall bisynthesis [Clostridium cavendishii DSM 21758]